jgi:hypothetical protein
MQLPTVTSRTSQTDTRTERGLSAVFNGRESKGKARVSRILRQVVVSAAPAEADDLMAHPIISTQRVGIRCCSTAYESWRRRLDVLFFAIAPPAKAGCLRFVVHDGSYATARAAYHFAPSRRGTTTKWAARLRSDLLNLTAASSLPLCTASRHTLHRFYLCVAPFLHRSCGYPSSRSISPSPPNKTRPRVSCEF